MTASPTPFFAKNARNSASMPSEEIERTLRAVAAAYPEDVFPEITAEERARLRAQNPDLQDRIAASMGRFLAKHLIAAADEIASFAPILAEKERVERNRDMWKGQCERQAKTLFDLRMQMLADERLNHAR